MRAIDVSVYSGEIPVEKWRKVKAEGYDLAVVGLFHGRTVNRYAVQQMRAAHEAGMELGAYVLLAPWTGANGRTQVLWGMEQIDVALEAQLRFVAIDCEIDGIDENMIQDAVREVERDGNRPIIYTGRWWWAYHFNDSKEFKDIPLWAAQYPLVHPDPPEAYLGNVALFGGWTRDKLVGWQYAGTTDLCGVSCDLNWFDDKFIKGEEPMPEFTKEQEKRITDIVNWCGPGLEMQARLAICRSLCGTEAAVMAGDWGALPGRLITIKELAQIWNRWEE